MKKIHSGQIIPVCSAAVAIVFIYLGITKFGFWHDPKGPMPGFVPTIIAVLLLAMSVLAFIRSFKETPAVFPRENYLAILACGAVIGATFLIGMIPSIALYVFLWLKFYEKCAWKQTLTVLIVIMAIVIGVFVLWLNVPFPEGLIYNAIYN